jgi:hypothetical protein
MLCNIERKEGRKEGRKERGRKEGRKEEKKTPGVCISFSSSLPGHDLD